MLARTNTAVIPLPSAPFSAIRGVAGSLPLTPVAAYPSNKSGAKATGSETTPDQAKDVHKDLCRSLEGVKQSPPSDAVVMDQLDRILRSKTFVQSEKLSRFLRFVVEHVIVGNPACLKEYLVGVEVYDRKPPYDPSQDSIVRTEARRLRNKLKEYYGAEGNEDPVYIYLRPGSYIPAFQSKEDLAGSPSAAEPNAFQQQNTSAIVTAILHFTDISGNSLSAAYARGIPDELAYVLMQKQRCTVISPSTTAYLIAQGLDVAATMKKVGAQLAFEGSARVEGVKLRVTARLVNATGVQLWVKRIDLETGVDASFAVEEMIADSLSAGIDAICSPELPIPLMRSPENTPQRSEPATGLLTVS